MNFLIVRLNANGPKSSQKQCPDGQQPQQSEWRRVGGKLEGSENILNLEIRKLKFMIVEYKLKIQDFLGYIIKVLKN